MGQANDKRMGSTSTAGLGISAVANLRPKGPKSRTMTTHWIVILQGLVP